MGKKGGGKMAEEGKGMATLTSHRPEQSTRRPPQIRWPTDEAAHPTKARRGERGTGGGKSGTDEDGTERDGE